MTRVLGVAAMVLAAACTGGPAAPQPLALLTPETLGREVGDVWQVEEPETDFTACGRPMPARTGQVATRSTALYSDPSLVNHEITTYADAGAARDAVSLLAGLPAACPRYDRRDPDGLTRVEVRPLAIAGTDAAVQFLAMYEHGQGAGWVVTAVLAGPSVSYVTVGDVDEGIPRDDHVAAVVRAARVTPR